MTKPTHVAVILGSTREGRLCDRIAAWLAGELDRRTDVTFNLVDPRTLELPKRHREENSSGLPELKSQLNHVDAFLVLTPEYNHSFPAPLKSLIDSVFNEWQAKPIGFVSYGGMSGGIRAVEQLRQVFAELHAITVRDTVGFINVWEQFSPEGQLQHPERAQAALKRVMAQLLWWARASQRARAVEPYAHTA